MRLKLSACGVLIALAVAGCGGAQTKCNDPDGAPARSGANTTKCAEPAPAAQSLELKFEVVAEDRLPSELAAWKTATAGQTQIKGGSIAHQRIGEHIYIAVMGGEQPTGGYRVEVGQVKLTADAKRELLSFDAKLLGPAPGTGTAQAITYPRTYIKVPYDASKQAPVVEGKLEVVSTGTSAAVKEPGPVAGQPPTPAAPPAATAPKTDAVPAAKPQQPEGVVQFQAIDGKQLPKELQGWAAGSRAEAGAAAEAVGGVLYVKVEAGEQRTGGYRVEIRKVELVGGEVKVQAVLHRPAPGAMVTQALTYPKAFAQVPYQGSGTLKAQVEWVR